mgnify:CR=1 FL=1
MAVNVKNVPEHTLLRIGKNNGPEFSGPLGYVVKNDQCGLVAYPGVLVGGGEIVDVLYQLAIVVAAGHIHAIGVAF